MSNNRCIYAGSFNPITNGHIDIIDQALNLFDEVVIVVASNSDKRYDMNINGRFDLVKKVIDNVYDANTRSKISILALVGGNLINDMCISYGIFNIIRGLRASDYEYESMLKTAYQNSIHQNYKINLVYLTPNNLNNLYVSSTMVRQIYSSGNSCPLLVNRIVHDEMIKMYSDGKI